VTKNGQGHSVASTHQNATTTPLLTNPQSQTQPATLSRCDYCVTHAVSAPIVTRDPRPVPDPYRSPNAVSSPTAVVTCFGHQKSRSLANAMRELAASERRQTSRETAQL
jgi:hypothetical protein